MKEEKINIAELDYISWYCIPVQYDNYSKEKDDNYEGDIFGRLSDFESPHFLFRRFHRNYCKAVALTKLKSYAIKNDDNVHFTDELKELLSKKYKMKQLMMHNAIVLLVCSLETYLKDNFIYINRNFYPEKLNNEKPEKVARKFNFQNLESINKAYKWLLPNFNDTEIYQIPSPQTFNPFFDCRFIIEYVLQTRHKIIHEGFYDNAITENDFNWFSYSCLSLTENYNSHFEINGYYNQEAK